MCRLYVVVGLFLLYVVMISWYWLIDIVVVVVFRCWCVVVSVCSFIIVVVGLIGLGWGCWIFRLLVFIVWDWCRGDWCLLFLLVYWLLLRLIGLLFRLVGGLMCVSVVVGFGLLLYLCCCGVLVCFKGLRVVVLLVLLFLLLVIVWVLVVFW